MMLDHLKIVEPNRNNIIDDTETHYKRVYACFVEYINKYIIKEKMCNNANLRTITAFD